MKKLSILLSTINDRIYAAEPLLQNRFEDTEFVVVHQITNLSKTDTYSNFYNKFDSAYVRFVPMFAKGTGKSRNLAMQKAEGELMYLCDDDLVFQPDFYTNIMSAAAAFPDIDIFTFQVLTTDGQPFKQYPDHAYQHNIRTTAKVSIVEMVIRKQAYATGKIKFDERFGLATIYNTGEEFVMLSDALKKGITAKFIPQYLVSHPPISSGKIFNEEVAFDKGAMTARVYGWKFIFANAIFALKKYTTYRKSIGFFSFTYHIYKGSMHFLKND